MADIDPRFVKPGLNVAEITVIGTGGGYGESTIIHIGEDEWIVVDSCKNPTSGECLPLQYLKEIGVDIAKAVKLIICTHWHDDHINGLSILLDDCKTAKFCFTKVSDLPKFLALLSLDYKKLNLTGLKSSTIEFIDCLKIAKNRGNVVSQAVADRILLRRTNGIDRYIASLSPSDQTVADFDGEVSQLLKDYGPPGRKIIVQSPNDKSIALYLKFGDNYAILGADLEVGNHANKGWLAILNHSTIAVQKAKLFKVPHHGSSNGYCTQIYTQLLEKNPVSNLTPFNRSNKLPDPAMLQTYCGHSDKVYITSPMVNPKPKKRGPSVDKIIEKFNIKMTEVKFAQGLIRCRMDFTVPNNDWTVETFDAAFWVNPNVKP